MCWLHTPTHSLTLASADVMVFLYREVLAYARFLAQWAAGEASETAAARLLAEAAEMRLLGSGIHGALNKYLWDPTLGHYVAYNVSTSSKITNRVFLMALPIWQQDLTTPEQVSSIIDSITVRTHHQCFVCMLVCVQQCNHGVLVCACV